MHSFEPTASSPVHGGNIQEFARKMNIPADKVRDFSSNINPLGLPDSLKKIYHEAVEKIAAYPDRHAEKFCRAVSAFHQIDRASVIAGNGSMALIGLVIQALKPARALLVEPGFGEYRRLLHLSGTTIDHVHLKEEDNFQFPFDDINKRIPTVDLVILGHPNNPTGTALTPEQLFKLMKKAQTHGTCLLVDEAFVDWHESDSVIRYVKDCSTAVVVRSLTKFYCLAGIRAGYACASRAVMDRLRQHQETWGCNQIAQELAAAALMDIGFQEKSRAWFDEESRFMSDALSQINGIKPFPSRANFFLCKIPDLLNVGRFWKEMGRYEIYLRTADDFIGLDQSYFRTAVKKREDNLFLLDRLTSILSNRTAHHDRTVLSLRR